MADRDRRHTTNKPHRSFVVSDFAVRDIPFALLAFFMICVASVVLGLVVESFSSLWRGCVLGIVITILAMEVLRQIPGNRLNENREASMSITKRTRLTFIAGGSIAVMGVVLRFAAKSLSTQRMGGLSTIDEAALDQFLLDSRIMILCGAGLILLAWHRWLWTTDTEPNVGDN